MATKKRVQVSFEEPVYRLLQELSDASNTSMSAIVSEMITQVAPQLLSITKALLYARKRNLDSFELLEQVLLESINEASQLGLDISETKRKYRKQQKNDE